MVTVKELIQECEKKLNRELTKEEIDFIHWMVNIQL